MILHWHIFWFLILFGPHYFCTGYDLLVKPGDLTCEELSKTKKTKLRYGILITLISLFYLACFNNWIIHQYVFGIILVVLLYTGIGQALLLDNSLINGFLLFELLLDTAIVVYLIYIIPETQASLREIIIPIVAALYGSVAAILGVYWTIKHSNKKYDEEQKTKIKPFLYVDVEKKSDCESVICLDFYKDNLSNVNLQFGTITNNDNGIFIVNRAIINDKTYYTKHPITLNKNSTANVRFAIDKNITFDKFLIEGIDIRNNIIQYECILNPDTHMIEYIVENNIKNIRKQELNEIRKKKRVCVSFLISKDLEEQFNSYCKTNELIPNVVAQHVFSEYLKKHTTNDI